MVAVNLNGVLCCTGHRQPLQRCRAREMIEHAAVEAWILETLARVRVRLLPQQTKLRSIFMHRESGLATTRLAKIVIPLVGLCDDAITVNGNANRAVWVKAVSAGRGRD